MSREEIMKYKIQRREFKKGALVEIPFGSIGVTVIYENMGIYDYRVTWLEPLIEEAE